MLHLRMTLPPALTEDVLGVLLDDPRVFAMVVGRGTARRPDGDALSCDVAREGAHDVLDQLIRLGVGEVGTLAVEEVDAAPSKIAAAAELAAPGAPDDGVVWPLVAEHAWDGVRPSWSFYAFLMIATQLAAAAVILDSSILVVGAMVVSPDFAPVAAIMVGTVLRSLALVTAGVRQLVVGLGFAIIATLVCALALRWGGLITLADVTGPRPQTAFIWHPDAWSFIVAVLAGAAGVLAITSGRASVMVGVFISVTTIPAAGNLALGLAFLDRAEIVGSLQQLGLNLAGMIVSGIITLLLQRLAWKSVGRAFKKSQLTRKARRVERDHRLRQGPGERRAKPATGPDAP